MCSFLQCKEIKNTSPGNKEILIKDLISFTIKENVQFIEGRGIENYIAFFKLPTGDSLIFEYGENVDKLNEVVMPVFHLSTKDETIKNSKSYDQESVFFSNSPEEDFSERIFSKNYYLYDTVNSIVVKRIRQKRNGIGTTGLYAPELKNGKSFSLAGYNLKFDAIQLVEEIFGSLKYK
jgi:hypothetical protein